MKKMKIELSTQAWETHEETRKTLAKNGMTMYLTAVTSIAFLLFNWTTGAYILLTTQMISGFILERSHNKWKTKQESASPSRV